MQTILDTLRTIISAAIALKRLTHGRAAGRTVRHVRCPVTLAAGFVALLASRALAQAPAPQYIVLADTGAGGNGDASVIVACPGKSGGNGQRNTVPVGGSVTVNGCGGSSIISSAGSSLISCPDYVGGTNVNRYNMTSNAQVVIVSGCKGAKSSGGGPSATPTPHATPTPATTPMPPAPTPAATASPLPVGVPPPPAIPPVPALRSPVTLKPGAAFGGYVVYGNGVTDDTPAINAALAVSDVLVAPASYAVAGNVTIPTGRNISCQSGAIFLDTTSKMTRMFQIGFSSGSIGNNSIVGCTLDGTDTAANYSTYTGGVGGYSELFEIASGWGLHTDNVLIKNNIFQNGQGDNIITYSPCGTANTGASCNNGAPGSEGPSHIFIVNNTISHCAQPGIHFNGGQLLVATGNTLTDCNADDEVDSNVLQVVTAWWSNNTFTTVDGTFNTLSNRAVGPKHTCTGNTLIPENDKGCYSYNNDISGVGLAGPSILWEPSGCAGGGGHYINDSLSGGAALNSGC